MDPSAFIQGKFRIRSGDSVGLNTDSGWAAAENTNATIETGQELRIRFKVRETAGGTDTTSFKLQVKRNAGSFVDLDVLGGTTAPAAQAVLSSQFADGDATSTELLTNEGSTYVNGVGDEDNASGNFSLTSEETELEFCIWLQSFHDGPAQNVVGDTLEFRVVEGDDTVFTGTYTNPVITIAEKAGYVGGTYIETPIKIGPYADANNNIYIIIEHAESENNNCMAKSTDDGDTWREMDGAGRPTTVDLEGYDMVKVGDTLHCLQQEGADVVYHRFTMSDHSTTPDEWTIIDEAVATVTEFTTQCCTLAVLSDGRIRAFYVDDASPLRVRYKTRSTGGTWGGEETLDSEASTDFMSPACVLAESDTVYVIYKDDTNGIIYVRDINSSDTLSGRTSISTGIDTASSGDNFPYAPPVYYDDGGVEVIAIIYQKDGSATLAEVFSRFIRDGSLGPETTASDKDVERDQGGSHQTIATATVDAKTVHLIYSENVTNDLWHAENDDEGGWGTDVEIHDAVTAQWVRAQVITHGGGKVLGYIWDYESDGGSGRIFYSEITLSSTQALTAVEIASGQVVPTSTLINLNTLSPTEIASGQVVSTPTVSSLATLLPIEIASGQVVSAPTLLPGAVSLLLTEIASGQVVSVLSLLNVNTLPPLEITSGSSVPVPVLLNVNILTMIDITSGQVIPVPTLLAGGVNVSPVEIATGQAVNIPTLLNVSTLSPSEIASGQAFGTPTLSSLTTIVMIDIASGQVVSVPVLLSELFLSPVSIGSDQVVSIPSLLNVNTITVVEVSDGSLVSVPSLSSLAAIIMIDIASGQAIPVPVVQSGLILSPLELGDLSVVSTPTLSPGAVSVLSVDIASGQAVPIPSLSSLNTLVVVEIATSSIVSSPVLLSSITVSPFEIPSGSASGVPVLDATATILPIHILSGLSVPGPALSVLSTLAVTEIGSGQTIPTPTVSPDVVVTAPVSIASGSSVGILTLILGGDFVQPVEVISGSVVSTPSLIPGVVLVSPVEIRSGSVVSALIVVSTLILSPVAIASGQIVSIPVLFGGGGVVILFGDQIVLVTFGGQPGIIQFRDQPAVILYEV